MGEGLAATRVLWATVLTNLGLAAIVGAWASVLWLRSATSPWASTVRQRAWSTLRAAGVFTIASDVLLLWLQAAYLGQVPPADALAMLPSMASHTHVGRAWAGGLVGLLLVLPSRGDRRSDEASWAWSLLRSASVRSSTAGP